MSDFDTLQRRLVALWPTISTLGDDDQTIVVVPSLTVAQEILDHVTELPAYEERLLVLLLLLRQRNARMVMVTSMPVAPEIVDYYLGLIPDVDPASARDRLVLLTPHDPSPRPLSQKLLERPRLLSRIRSHIPDGDRAHLVPFTTSTLERDLALALDIPLYGADPRYLPFGTKTGSRQLFRRARVEHPRGSEGVRSVTEVVHAVQRMRHERPDLASVVLKLDEGISGFGNHIVPVDGLPEALDALPAAYLAAFAREGGVVEELVTGGEVLSPSAQFRVTPDRDVELLSTHDQVLGGPTGQVYLGCRFPACADYAATIAEEGTKVAHVLAAEGVLGRFAVDFVVVRDAPDEQWRTYAIEVNLRKGGTTHPFLALHLLTDGSYDGGSATYTTSAGERRCLVASDNVADARYRALTPLDLIEIVSDAGLAWDPARRSGVVLHMLSALSGGRFGMTAIAESHGAADALFAAVAERA